MAVPMGITSLDLDGISMNMVESEQTIPPKLFRPLQIWGQLIDAKPTFRVSR
jgi:hypothetical protein